MSKDSSFQPTRPQGDPEDEGLPTSGLIETSSFFRQIVHERNFRIGLAFLISVLALVGAALPPVWKTTPSGFQPVVRVSLLSLMESRSLAKSARQLDAEGKTEEAITTWRQAIFKNLGNQENGKGLLKTLAQQPIPSAKWLNLGIGQAYWTLRISNGGREERILASEFFAKYEMPEYVYNSLHPIAESLNDSNAALFLKSCFQTQHFDEFGQGLNRFPGALEADPELAVYQAAWESAWGPTSELNKGKSTLAKARMDPKTLVTANRLQLSVSEVGYDWATFSLALQALKDFHADRPIDHVAEWRMLEAMGRSVEARERARKYSSPPNHPSELKAMVEMYIRLGMEEYGADFLQKHLPTLGDSPDLWALQAELLIRLGRWDDLRVMAIELRMGHPELNLVGYAWFLEGLVNLRYHLSDQAAYSFSRVPERPIGDPLLGYVVARKLIELGYPKIAEATLANLERIAGNTSDYWFNVTTAALASGQFDTAAQAAEKAYRLRPDHPINQMNYAAVLLTLRTNSDLAVQLTLRHLREFPDQPAAKINHALALLQNNRLMEAEELLKTVSRDVIDAPTSTSLALAIFELRYRQNQNKEALDAYRSIQLKFLQSPQSNWVEKVHQKLLASNKSSH